MSWVEFPEIVFPSIDLFFKGKWPEQAEVVKSLELPLPPAKVPASDVSVGHAARVMASSLRQSTCLVNFLDK